MHTLSSVIKTIFVDADFNTICNSRNGIGKYAYQEVDSESFAVNFRHNDGSFGTDANRTIVEHVKEYWMHCDGLKDNVVNILFNSSSQMLEHGVNSLVCKYEKFLLWNEVSRIVGEDLFVCAFMADHQTSYALKSFAWKPFLESNSTQINDLLKKGLYEIHSHFNGASLNFDISWLALMNGAKMNTDVCVEWRKGVTSSYKLLNARKAIAIRYFLYSFVKKNVLNFKKDYSNLNSILDAKTEQELESKLSDVFSSLNTAKISAFHFGSNVIDYAIPKEISKNDQERYYNVPLIGERIFLYEILKKIKDQDENSEKIGNLLYAYIVAKNQFRNLLIQHDQYKGFSHFQAFEVKKTLFDESPLYKKLVPYMAAQCVVNNQPIKVLESRLAPKNSVGDNIRYLRNTNKSIRGENLRCGQPDLLKGDSVKLGFVFHFIKKADSCRSEIEGSLYCRNHQIRNKIKKQANAIYKMVEKNNHYVKGGYEKGNQQIFPLVGIDAANEEFGCRPEVFAPVFRRLKYIPRSTELDHFYKRTDYQLGRTFHVGEAYYDIIDGLRAIDECVNFMNFGERDRLGHAVALGVDAYQYYKVRRFKVILPKHDLLDDIAWMYAKMKEFSIPDQDGLMYRLEGKFRVLYAEIYGKTQSSSFLLKTVNIEDYYDAWKLRGDDPNSEEKDKYWFKECLNEGDDLNVFRIKGSVTQLLYHDYHFNGAAKEEGRKPIEFEYLDNDYQVVKQIQHGMRKKIADKHIAIETNPTSNLQITDVERYSEHPIVSFNSKFLDDDRDEPNIDVSINTDDQGVFATSLEKEFTLMAIALSKVKDQDGKPLYKEDDIYAWLDHVRDSARTSSFVQ